MSKRLMALQNERADLLASARGITNLAEISAEKETELAEILAKVTALDAKIAQEQQLIAAEAAQPVRHVIADRSNVIITGGEPAIMQDPKRGFANAGEFFRAVHSSSKHGSSIHPSLAIGAAPTSYANEGVGADGGFLVPPEFATAIRSHALSEDAYITLTDNMPVGGNSMTYPKDETTPWGSNGVRAYWEAEAGQATQTKLVVGAETMRLNKLFALVPVTDEMTADAPFLSAYLTSKTGNSIRYKTNAAIVNGTGAGTPRGITASGALVVQAKETSQTAATINASNIAKMYGRNTNPTGATWLLAHDAFNQLMTMTVGNQLVWTPPSEGFKQAPGGFLMGRPVLLSNHCETLGTQNDILFVDFKQYLTITKAAGVEYATSIHLWFDYGVSAFRATFRIDGQPWVDAAVSPAKGSSTRSPFVTLAVRS